MARRPRPWDGVRPRDLRGEAGLAGVRCAPGPAATATPWLCQKVKGPAGGRPEGPGQRGRGRREEGRRKGLEEPRPRPVPTPSLPRPPGFVAAPIGRTLGARSSRGSAPLPDGEGCALSVGRTGCYRTVSRTPSKPSLGTRARRRRGAEVMVGCSRGRCHASTDYTSSAGEEAEERSWRGS